jgi:hypothetical protein
MIILNSPGRIRKDPVRIQRLSCMGIHADGFGNGRVCRQATGESSLLVSGKLSIFAAISSN